MQIESTIDCRPSPHDEAALKRAEKRIQRIMIDLEEEVGKRIDHVEVDTRNFANFATDIVLCSA